MDFLKAGRNRLRDEIAFFRQLRWKDRLSAASVHLAFWGGLLAGAWQVGQGLYEGPNYAAARAVVIDQIAEWRTEGKPNAGVAYWSLEYHFVRSNGETVSRRISVNSDDQAASRIRDAKTGDEILLRIGVPSGEPGAVFGINKDVRQGLAIICLLLVLWYFGRDGFLDIDAASGEVVPAKARVIKLLLAFFGTMLGLLWLTSPVIP